MSAPDDAWAEYQAAARRLDEVRRALTAVATEHTHTAQAAALELSGVRARLAPQRSRLVRDLGVPEQTLTPSPDEVAAAAQAVAAGPAAALVALRQARATADAADAATVTPGPAARGWTPWLRNLLVYGPFALAVLAVQIGLYLTAAADALPVYALVFGLLMPAVAFGLGWLTIGFVFGSGRGGRGGRGGRVDRSPVLGAVVCAAPVLVTCMGVGLLAILR
jgi:hypothetical protein